MSRCLICKEEILPDSKCVSRNVEAGVAEAHHDCILKLRALIESPAILAQGIQKSSPFAIVERVGNDWMLVRRDVSVSIQILAYLEKQSSPCDVKSLYEWLRKNEVDIQNPSDSVQKMKKSGLVAVMNSDTARLLRITEKGLTVLRESESKKEGPT